jgi:hypothetical protein
VLYLCFCSLLILVSCKNISEGRIIEKDSEEGLQIQEEVLEDVMTRPSVPKYMQVILEKKLLYDTHTLDDTYPYGSATREFQIKKIIRLLAGIDSLREMKNQVWAVLQNKKNANGFPPICEQYTTTKDNVITDMFGVEREQGIPLYQSGNLTIPERYNYDGALVRVNDTIGKFTSVSAIYLEKDYLVPTKYLKLIDDTVCFNKLIVVDRRNQNISTYEKTGDIWTVRSMNPATTGANRTIYQRPTPLGLFVIQQKVFKMFYYKDGTEELDGYAPYANRFCQGAYIHGVPVALPRTEIIEYSGTLGTIPRSHMCVRNVTSHAKYIYDNYPAYQTLVYVIE